MLSALSCLISNDLLCVILLLRWDAEDLFQYGIMQIISRSATWAQLCLHSTQNSMFTAGGGLKFSKRKSRFYDCRCTLCSKSGIYTRQENL